MDASLQPVSLGPEAELTMYRVVQEAFTTIAKYAQAHDVRVVMRPEGGWAHIEVTDDGQGFDPQAPMSGRHGLRGMRYRVESAGGEFEVESAPGEGTCVRARIPQRLAPTAAASAEAADPVDR